MMNLPKSPRNSPQIGPNSSRKIGSIPPPTGELLDSLRQQIQHCESFHHEDLQKVTSSGCGLLDATLPHGGFRAGSVVEWLASGPGSGASHWAMLAAMHAAQNDEKGEPSDRLSDRHGSGRVASANSMTNNSTTFGRAIVVIDQARTFYPPAAAALGIDLRRLVVVHPCNTTDAMWGIDQALRCPAVAAVWAAIPRLDPRDGRRFQLAAEEGGGLGLFLRPLAVRGKPSWADVQILVQPQTADAKGDRRWRFTLLRCRGGKLGTTIDVPGDPVTDLAPSSTGPPADQSIRQTIPDHPSLNSTSREHETNSLHLVAQLARSANCCRSASA